MPRIAMRELALESADSSVLLGQRLFKCSNPKASFFQCSLECRGLVIALCELALKSADFSLRLRQRLFGGAEFLRAGSILLI